MSKRLQVVLEDAELEEIQEAAAAEETTVSEWVRRALCEVRRGRPARPREAKLAAVKLAASYAFPTADVERMLEEIERGRGDGCAP